MLVRIQSQPLQRSRAVPPRLSAHASALALLLLCAASLAAQAIHSQPVVDSSSQASPIANPPSKPAVDASSTASPVSPASSTDAIPAGVTLRVHLSRAVSSVSAHNGETLPGALESPVRTAAGRTLPAGTAVTVMVIAAAPAGQLSSAGQLSLQVVQVGKVAVLSDILDRNGDTGPSATPDGLPAKGTEAIVAAGSALSFAIPPMPGSSVPPVSSPSLASSN